MTVVYNENDPVAAFVLQHLADSDIIAQGRVDNRSIKDIDPIDLEGVSQFHAFAGAGLWSIAARLAGWPNDRPLWTGSCPCQPFSQAGKGAGTDDPRHLWPDFFRLIRACRPPIVVGEQVAGSAGYGWLDGVRADLEGEGYACRAVDIPACAMDAPHIRNRIYWVAVANAVGGRERRKPNEFLAPTCRSENQIPRQRNGGAFDAIDERVADADSGGRARRAQDEIGREEHGAATEWPDDMEQAASERRGEGRPEPILRGRRPALTSADVSGVTQNGTYWSDAEWIICHDGKARRTKPGLRLLVNGMARRTDLWRLAGNSIVPHVAAEVLKALMETLDEQNQASEPPPEHQS